MARLLHPDQPEAQMQETEAWENGTSLEQSARPVNRIVAANIPWPSTSTRGLWYLALAHSSLGPRRQRRQRREI
jgi:hypothetical protein